MNSEPLAIRSQYSFSAEKVCGELRYVAPPDDSVIC